MWTLFPRADEFLSRVSDTRGYSAKAGRGIAFASRLHPRVSHITSEYFIRRSHRIPDKPSSRIKTLNMVFEQIFSYKLAFDTRNLVLYFPFQRMATMNPLFGVDVGLTLPPNPHHPPPPEPIPPATKHKSELFGFTPLHFTRSRCIVHQEKYYPLLLLIEIGTRVTSHNHYVGTTVLSIRASRGEAAASAARSVPFHLVVGNTNKIPMSILYSLFVFKSRVFHPAYQSFNRPTVMRTTPSATL